MKNLYDLTADYENILARLDTAETDEEKEAVLAELDEAIGAIEAKAEIYAKVIKNKQAEAEAYATEAARLTANKRSAENCVERLKTRLLEAMQSAGIPEITTPIGKWRMQPNPWSAEVVDANKVPPEWQIPQEPKIDKAGLVKYWKETGSLVDGIQFCQKQGLRFR